MIQSILEFAFVKAHGSVEAELARTTAPRSGQLTVGYARVSCHDQKADLPRQSQRLRQNAGADMVLVKDIGSGLNCRKPRLKKLLALLVSGSVRELVLTYKDRLLRFGSELAFQLGSRLGIKVTVLDDAAPKSPAAAFADDVLAIITVFSAKLYGARAHRPKPPPSIAQLCPSLPAAA